MIHRTREILISQIYSQLDKNSKFESRRMEKIENIAKKIAKQGIATKEDLNIINDNICELINKTIEICVKIALNWLVTRIALVTGLILFPANHLQRFQDTRRVF